MDNGGRMSERVIGKVLGISNDQTDGSKEADELWYWALLKTLRADMRADKLFPPGIVEKMMVRNCVLDECYVSAFRSKTRTTS